MQSHPSMSSCTLKVLVIGNPGRGKSSLCNALLGQDVFQTGVSANPVTQRLQCATTTTATGIAACVLDMPGFIEPGQEAQSRNTQLAVQATELMKEKPSVVVFVADGTGRLSSDDVDAWRSLFAFLECPLSAISVAVNMVAQENAGPQSQWQAEYREQFCARTGTTVQRSNFAFIPQIDTRELRGCLSAYLRPFAENL
eukprot:m51a1_g14560 hypothetical protein (198) ;mRNA; r:1030743-1031407